MSDERVDIEVSDKVDASIGNKLRDIAKEARSGQTSVDKLKSALRDINSTPVRRLAEASQMASSSIMKELQAVSALSTAAKASADAETRLTRAKRDATDAQELLRGANLKAADVLALRKKLTDEVAAAEANAQAATKNLANATKQAASAEKTIASARDQLLRSTDPVGYAQQRLNQQMMLATQLYSAGVITQQQYTQAMTVLNQRVATGTQLQNGLNLAQQRGLMAARGFTGQIIGMGQALYSTKDPMQALLMYGSQFVSMFGGSKLEGGFRGMASGVLAFVRSAGPAIVVIGAVAGAFGLLHRELNKEYPTKVSDGLNLTKEQLKRVKNDTVTFGDTVVATFQVIGEEIMNGPVGPAIRWIGDTFNDVMDWIASDGEKYMSILRGTMIGTYKFIVDNWRKFPAAFGEVFVNATNSAIEAINGLISKASQGLNAFINQVNRIPGLNIPTITTAQISKVQNQYEGAGRDLGVGYVQSVVGGIQDEYKRSQDMVARIGARALDRARKRVLKEAGDPNKGSKNKGEKPWDRAGELVNVNRELDNELARMGMLKDAREVQNRLDQISQKFAEKRVPLNDAETASIKRKLEAIQQAARIQSESDRIYEAANGPLQKYNASLEAAKQLQQQGAITQAQMTAEIVRAGVEYNTATDPLYEFNKALDDQAKLYGIFGQQLQVATAFQQAANAAAASATPLIDAQTGAMTRLGQATLAKIQADIQAQTVNQKMAELFNQTSADAIMLANKQAYYAAIEQFRQQDVRNEEAAMRMKAALDQQYNEIRFKNTNKFLGDLASLQSSKNKEMARIGKAAAIAQATIAGFQAVQNALATPAPWPIPLAMAAAAGVASAAQIAGIMSTNVGNFQNGGAFIVKGRDGVDQNNINMNVSRGERVSIETQAQQRKSGTTVKIYNYANGTSVSKEVDSNGDVRVIVREEIRKELPKLNEEQFQDPNSKTSKAASRAFGLTRNRGSG